MSIETLEERFKEIFLTREEFQKHRSELFDELPRPPLRSRRGIPGGQVRFLPASSPSYRAGFSRIENKLDAILKEVQAGREGA